MKGYYENSSIFYLPQLSYPAISAIGVMRYNHLHWQSAVEVACVFAGQVGVEIETEKFTLTAGDVVTIDTHHAHSYYDGSDDNLLLMLTIDETLLHRAQDERMWFSTVGLNALAKDDPDVVEMRRAVASAAKIIEPYKTAMWTDKTYPPISGLDWHSYRMEVSRVMMLLYRHVVPASSENFQQLPNHFLRCIEYIHEHYQGSCSAEEVAHASGFSERSIRRLFRQYIGMNFSDYVTSVRLDAACTLLEDERRSISDVAGAVGLSDSSFYRIFRQNVGVTPSEYQRNLHTSQSPQRYSAHDFYASNVLGLNRFDPKSTFDWDSLLRGEYVKPNQ